MAYNVAYVLLSWAVGITSSQKGMGLILEVQAYEIKSYLPLNLF